MGFGFGFAIPTVALSQGKRGPFPTVPTLPAGQSYVTDASGAYVTWQPDANSSATYYLTKDVSNG